MMLVLDAVIIVVVASLYKEFLAISFDEEYGTAVGIPTERLYLVMLCLIALTVVILIRVVGIILVIALLTIPTAMAKQFTHDIRNMMLLSTLFGVIFTLGGLWLSNEFELASGATIILLGGTLFLFSLAVSWLRGRKRQHLST
jgi:zinc transport system permease protein